MELSVHGRPQGYFSLDRYVRHARLTRIAGRALERRAIRSDSSGGRVRWSIIETQVRDRDIRGVAE
jgi:hypothetical protein